MELGRQPGLGGRWRRSGNEDAGKASPAPGDSILISDVPHDWLFPQMAAVVHHAGAGTTAAGLRAGVPTVSVPKISDQPFWAARLAALGAAPPPVPDKRLSAAALTAAIQEATTRPSYRAQAQALADRLAGEDGTGPVIEAVIPPSAVKLPSPKHREHPELADLRRERRRCSSAESRMYSAGSTCTADPGIWRLFTLSDSPNRHRPPGLTRNHSHPAPAPPIQA